MSEMVTQFMNDISILTANPKSLDKFWGVSYNMPRPRLPNSNRLLTDDEYRVYLYLRNCRLMTMEDLEINFNKCFALDDYDIYFSNEQYGLTVTDHLSYESIDDGGSNLHINAEDDSGHFVTDFENDEETMLILSNLSEDEEIITIVNIPFNDWDDEFLRFMEQHISIRGDLKIREYML